MGLRFSTVGGSAAWSPHPACTSPGATQPQPDPAPSPTLNGQQESAEDPYSVLQLPTDVLHYFLASITDAEQLRCLSLVCTRARAAIRQLHGAILLQMPLSVQPEEAAEELCVAATNQCRRLRVQGRSPVLSPTFDDGRFLELAGEVLCRVPLPAVFRCVTTFELKLLRLDTLVPSWLHLIGPQLTTLVIKDCYITALPDQAPTPCPSIRSLHVSQLRYIIALAVWLTAEGAEARAMQDYWRTQIAALPGLQTLTWTEDLQADRERNCRALTYCFSPSHTITPLLPTHTLTTIQQLDLPWVELSDADMDTLLAMPALRDVGFGGMRLTQDYSQRGCQWEQLTCGRLQADQLPRLPLQSLRTLRLRCEPSAGSSERPQGYKCVVLAIDGAFSHTAGPVATVSILQHIRGVSLLPAAGCKSDADTELIIRCTCGTQGPWALSGSELVRPMAGFEALWVALTRHLPTACHTVTLQLSHSQFSVEFLSALCDTLQRSTPSWLHKRLRLELYDSCLRIEVTRELLSVTAGVPLCLTIWQKGLETVRHALKHAQSHTGEARSKLTVQFLYPANVHDRSRPEHDLLAAAARAGFALSVVYVKGEAPARMFGSLSRQAARQVSGGVKRVIGFLTG